MKNMTLKTLNKPIVTIFLIVNVALYLVLSQGVIDFWPSLLTRIQNLKAIDSLFCILTPLLLGVANGLLPASFKATLVFWRINNPLPGCRAFSDLATRDHRINMEKLKSRLDPMPTSPEEQNSSWYQIYKQVSDSLIVRDSHRQFLLNRDLTGVSALFFFFGSISLLPAGADLTNIMIYSLITASEFIIFSIVARNNGNRFVCNVLTEYLD